MPLRITDDGMVITVACSQLFSPLGNSSALMPIKRKRPFREFYINLARDIIFSECQGLVTNFFVISKRLFAGTATAPSPSESITSTLQ